MRLPSQRLRRGVARRGVRLAGVSARPLLAVSEGICLVWPPGQGQLPRL